MHVFQFIAFFLTLLLNSKLRYGKIIQHHLCETYFPVLQRTLYTVGVLSPQAY
jgi:hypothetical protein